MFCFNSTCRICKCTTNPFTSTCNNQNEFSHLFFNMFPELMNSKLNHFLRNVCTYCMKQLTLFANFKNHCIQTDQCFLHYINQFESHDGPHTEIGSELDIKQENCPNDNSQIQSTFESNDIQEATNYYDPTVHSSTNDIEIDIKQEISTSDNEETNFEENEGNIVKQTNSISGCTESESRDIGDTIIKQEMFISDYDESGIQRILIDSSMNIPQDVPSIPDIKQEYCHEKDDLNNTANYGINEIDIVKHQISIDDKEVPCNAGNFDSNLMAIDHMVNNNKSQEIAYTKQVFCQGNDPIHQTYKNNDFKGNENFFHSEVHSIAIENDSESRIEEIEVRNSKTVDYTTDPYLIKPNRSVTGQKIYTCNICQNNFSQKIDLINHKKTHIGKRPHVCDICNKAFLQKSHMNVHKRTHTGEKPYECDVCKKSFSQKNALMNHKNTHTGERPYVCDICKKAFVEKSHMRVHRRTHTGEKPYECDICEKYFFLRSHLKQHKKTHTGERPYVCDICKKAFVQESHMIVHKRTHTGEKPFECNICRKSFSQKITLIKHEKTHNR